MELFSASKLKIDRAVRHIRDFNDDISSYARKNPYQIVIEGDDFRHMYVLRVLEDVPAAFSCYIGDIVHNLRASLDLLACDLVRRANKPIKNVYFPFASGPQWFEAAIKKGNISRAGRDVVDMIQSMKPYKGGNEHLWSIHELDIADKHTALIPVSHIIGTPGFDMVDNATGAVLSTIATQFVMSPKDGLTLVSSPATKDVQLGQKFNLSFNITFGEGQPLADEPVLITLERLTKVADGIIDTFIRHFSTP